MSGEADVAIDGDETVSLNAWYVLALLTTIFTCCNLDRGIITILLDPIKREFGLTDGQLGLLAGPMFALAYVCAAVPLGVLADRTKRTRIYAPLILAWSLLSILCGYASSFIQLLLMRMGVGATEAGASPISLSLISDAFPQRLWPLATSILYFALPAGSALALFAGGWTLQHHGWRAAFMIAGAPGIVLALLLLLTVREPARRGLAPGAHEAPPPSLRNACGAIIGNRPLLLVVTGMTLGAAGGSAVTSWIPTFLIRAHGMAPGDVGRSMAVATLISGGTAALAGGWASSRLTRLGIHRLAYWCGMWMIMIVPATWAMLYSADIGGAFALLVLVTFSLFTFYGPAYAFALSLSPPHARAGISGILGAMQNLIGYGLGTLFTGMLSDLYKPFAGTSALALAMAMATAVVAALVGGILLLLSASKVARMNRRVGATLTSGVIG